MKIEKVNSNQIKCVLSKTDLTSREIKVSELAYGTEKAQELFKDMMAQASDEFGFETNDSPLMIEAVPLSSDSIMLIITKVENPEDIEEKFSNLPVPNTRTFKKRDTSTTNDKPALLPSKAATLADTANVFFVYRFDSLNHVTDASKRLVSMGIPESTLYKDAKENQYYLTLVSGDANKINPLLLKGLIAEYGEAISAKKSVLSYYKEHMKTLIKEDAITILSKI